MKFILNNNNKIIRIYQPDIINHKYDNDINQFIIDKINNIEIDEEEPIYCCLSDDTKYDIHKQKFIELDIDTIEYDHIY